MSPDTRTVLRDLGLVVHVPGIMALLSMAVALAVGERHALVPLAVTAAISVTPGQVLYRAFRGAGETRLHHAITIAVLAWLVIPIVGAIPYAMLATEPGAEAFAEPWNVAFESYSGFTGTGLTVVAAPSALPRTLQWWRSFSQWIGGVGVIMVMLSILRPTAGFHRLYFSEAREERIRPGIRATVRTIWWIFLVYTALAVGAFALCGAPAWEALNHGMTGIATGGFTITDDSFAGEPPSIRWVAMAAMIVGAISFAVHDRMLRGRLAEIARSLQHRSLVIGLVLGGIVVVLDAAWTMPDVPWLDVLFQWVSALTTAGFQSSDLSAWAIGPKLPIVLAMVVGGAAGSTVGGLKQVRIVLLAKGLAWRARRLSLRPHELQRHEYGGRGLSPDEARERVGAAASLAVAWVLVLAGTVAVLAHVAPPGFDLEDLIVEAASAQGNVGLSSGLTGASLHWAGKAALIAAMYVGRLEILPVLFLLVPWIRPGR